MSAVAPVRADLTLQGKWKMVEQLCAVPNKVPERIAPGYPGSRQEWVLTFLSDRDYSFTADYNGIMGNDCSLQSVGRYRTSENSSGGLSSLRLTPNPTETRQAGTFDPPCKVLTSEKSLLYEARMEPSLGRPVNNFRIRLRAPDIFDRCSQARAKMEIVFEPDLSSSWQQPLEN